MSAPPHTTREFCGLGSVLWRRRTSSLAGAALLVAIVGTHALRAQPARNLLPSRPADVVIVKNVMGQFMDLDGANPASCKYCTANSLPHMAPRPSPPCANDTVMQCMHEIV